jgi:hypothetical protein
MKKFIINKGTLQANGLYNITPKDKNDNRISYWFDEETKKELKTLSIDEFNKRCNEILNN